MPDKDNPIHQDNDWYKKALIEILEVQFRENRSARRWRLTFKALSVLLLSVLVFVSIFGTAWKKIKKLEPHVAMIQINGIISAKSDANADRVVKGLREAFSNPNSKAIFLKINSPGGSTAQAEAIYEEIKLLKKRFPKPVIAGIEDIGTSAAYYIAVASDKIYSSRSSIVGSIGVRIDSFNFTKLMNKLGIERKLYISGKYKGVLDMFSRPEPEAELHIKNSLKLVHSQFISVVKKNRESKLKDDPLLFTGMFWSGEEALELGLIDGILTTTQFDYHGLPIISYMPPVINFDKIISGSIFSAISNIISLYTYDASENQNVYVLHNNIYW